MGINRRPPLIKVLQHKEIDKVWWDQQLSLCTNNLIYTQSWYLDAVSPQWGAAIYGKDEIFIPLTHKRYFGIIPVWLQPLFCQQLGAFYKNTESKSHIKSMLMSLSKKYMKTVIHLNAHSIWEGKHQKINYILDLNHSYDKLRNNYTKDALKNLRKPSSFTLTKPDFNNENFLRLINTYKEQYGSKESLKRKKVSMLKNLLFAAKSNGSLLYYEMKDANNDLLLTAALLKDKKRIYYLFAAPTDLGKQQNITHHFIDAIIHVFADNPLILDFEGSMIPSVAHFYKKWGVQEETYGVYP